MSYFLQTCKDNKNNNILMIDFIFIQTRLHHHLNKIILLLSIF